MNILAMDTSNQLLGIAVLNDTQLIGEMTTNLSKNHSVRLMPAIDQLLHNVQLTPQDLDKIVVAKGPGSYTGVRIGLTTAKSMAWALDIPVVGVSSLEALAWQGRLSDAMICPFFDARRGLVYTGLYKADTNGLTAEIEDQNILMEEWLNRLADTQQDILMLSPDMVKHQELINTYLGERAIIPEGLFSMASPAHLGLAGLSRQPDALHALVPEYLRLAEAEAKWQERQRSGDA